MPTAFEIVAEPNRRRILDLLCEGERPVGEIVDALSVSQPAVSKHLRVLRDAGFVEARSDAQRRVYRLEPRPLQELDEWLEPYRRFWSGRLDALERRLDAMDEPERKSAARRKRSVRATASTDHGDARARSTRKDSRRGRSTRNPRTRR